MKDNKKIDWLVVLKIIGALITVAGVIFSLITGSIFGNTKKILGTFTMPLFGWIVALAGFILFIWARNKQVMQLEREQQEEFDKQMKEQNTQKQMQDIYNLQKQKKLPRRGLVVLIKKKDLIERNAQVATVEPQQKLEQQENSKKQIKKEGKKAVSSKSKNTKKQSKKENFEKIENKQSGELDMFIENEDVIKIKKSNKKGE
jgi:uncharacterized membrane protein